MWESPGSEAGVLPHPAPARSGMWPWDGLGACPPRETVSCVKHLAELAASGGAVPHWPLARWASCFTSLSATAL